MILDNWLYTCNIYNKHTNITHNWRLNVDLGADTFACPRTDISPKYDKLTNGRTGYRS